MQQCRVACRRCRSLRGGSPGFNVTNKREPTRIAAPAPRRPRKGLGGRERRAKTRSGYRPAAKTSRPAPRSPGGGRDARARGG